MTNVFIDPWALFYGTITVVAILLALHGRHAPLQCGLLLLTDWFGTVLAETFMGFDRAPIVIAALDASIAVCVLWVAVRNRCEVGAMIFAIFLVGGLYHVASFVSGNVSSATYYAFLNVLYLLSVLIVGKAGVEERLDSWLSRRHRLARASPAGR